MPVMPAGKNHRHCSLLSQVSSTHHPPVIHTEVHFQFMLQELAECINKSIHLHPKWASTIADTDGLEQRTFPYVPTIPRAWVFHGAYLIAIA